MELKAGTRLIIIGIVILVGSMATLLYAMWELGPPFDTTNVQILTTIVQLSWFFIFFASVMIFMGIRRASPV